MARGRMISKTLGTASKRFAELGKCAGKLGDFAQVLYVLLIVSADDFGRLDGDPWTVQHAIWSTSPRTLDEFCHALDMLERVGLIRRWNIPGGTVIQIERWDEHQTGLRKRTASKFPDPPDGTECLNASERDIENHLVCELQCGHIQPNGEQVVSVQSQVRVGNKWIDVLAKTENSLYVFEVKRQRATMAAIQQVTAYCELITTAASVPIPIVVAHGADPAVMDYGGNVTVWTYDDDLTFTLFCGAISPLCRNVISQSGSCQNVTLQQNLTEQNRTKRTDAASADAEPAVGDGIDGDEKQDGKTRAPKDPDGNIINGKTVRKFSDAFVSLYAERQHGAKYKWRGAKDTKLAIDLLSTYGHDRLLILADGLLQTDDEWISQTDRGIGILAVRASWLDSRIAEWEARHAREP